MGKLLTIIETARRLGVTEQTVRNWIRDGHVNVKTIGRARYIDEEFILSVQDTVDDIKRQAKAIESIRDEQRKDLEGLRDEKDRRRVMRVISGSCLRTGFLKTIVNLLELVDILSPREGMVLSGFLDGSTLDDMAKDYGVTRERVRQIAEKAIYKSSDLTKIKDLLEENYMLKTDNAVLKSANDSLVRKLSVYEDAEPVDDGICRLFATRLVDYNLSVRTLNCLKMGAKSSCMHVIVPPCETVGDLCRLKRAEFLMIRGVGKGCLAELDDFLDKLGLSWDMDVDSICAKRH